MLGQAKRRQPVLPPSALPIVGFGVALFVASNGLAILAGTLEIIYVPSGQDPTLYRLGEAARMTLDWNNNLAAASMVTSFGGSAVISLMLIFQAPRIDGRRLSWAALKVFSAFELLLLIMWVLDALTVPFRVTAPPWDVMTQALRQLLLMNVRPIGALQIVMMVGICILTAVTLGNGLRGILSVALGSGLLLALELVLFAWLRLSPLSLLAVNLSFGIGPPMLAFGICLVVASGLIGGLARFSPRRKQ